MLQAGCVKYILQTLFILTILLVSAACQQSAEPLPLLRIGHAPHDHHSALYIAAMNSDYFKEHGGIFLKETVFRKEYTLIAADRPIARVLIDSSTGGKELVRKLSEEYFDISFGGFPAMLHSIDQDNPIKILAPMMTEGAGLVVRNDLPVSSWTEFVEYVRKLEQPIKIGYKMAVSAQNLIFEQALRDTQIPYAKKLDNTQAKIIVLNLHGSKNLIPALTGGLVDGFVIMQPFLALAEEKGAGKVVAMLRDLPPHGKWQGHPCCALAGNEHYLQAQPEVAEAMLTLLMRATRFINEQPQQSAEQIGRWLDLPTSVEEKSLPTIQFSTDFSESWQRGVDFWVLSMIESGKLNNKVKVTYQQGGFDELISNRELYDRARSAL